LFVTQFIIIYARHSNASYEILRFQFNTAIIIFITFYPSGMHIEVQCEWHETQNRSILGVLLSPLSKSIQMRAAGGRQLSEKHDNV